MESRVSRSKSRIEFRVAGPARSLLLVLVGLSTLLCEGEAAARTHSHALVIGNNAAFTEGSGAGSNQPPLRYADDDAAAFAELFAEVAESSELLTVMDRETQALYPKLAGSARAPTRDAVKAAVSRISKRVAEEQAGGERSVVFVFFSGHGAVSFEGKPALALADGGLDHAFLYREILEKLPADQLHLLIDACHAEAIVRPRDLEAETVNVSAAQANEFLLESTLARFPQVGAIVAATTNTKAHEWDAIGHGIFTHELLSALRGAADVNRDRRLEYSEVYAFMSAANREVGDARARLSIVAKPPDANRRAALLSLADVPTQHLAWLAGVPGQRGILELEDVRGRRLVTLHGDGDSFADLLLPAGETLFVRGGGQEASFRAKPGETVSFDGLKFSQTELRERGALEEAVRHGLFAAEYGRRYYEGIVDQTPGFLPVDFSDTPPRALPGARAKARSPRSERALVLGGGLSTGVADVVTMTHGVSIGLRPLAKNGLALSAAGLFDGEGSLSEWHAKASAGWLFLLGQGAVRGHAGALLGGGLVSQTIDGGAERRSAFVALSPVLGLMANVSGGFGFWSELELSGALYQRDDRLALSFMPSFWLGGSLEL